MESVCPLEEKFLDICVRKKIPVCIHRRNVAKAIWIVGSVSTSKDDILTKQIFFKENKRKSLHIAKKLILAKFKSMEWLLPLKPLHIRRIKKAKTIDQVRVAESIHARKYWDTYYRSFGYENILIGGGETTILLVHWMQFQYLQVVLF